MQNREDFERCLFGYLDPLKRHVSPRAARVQLAGGSAQYEDEVISMEAWARPLWGLAPFWAGGGRSADGFYERIYPAGLAAGTDPACPEYWGRCRDHDQMFVEMAAIAYGLLLAPDVLWEPLPEDARVRVASWLFQVNEHTFPAGNWLWFRVLVNLALRELGCAHDGGAIQADLDTLDSYYEGNGWYKDGPTGLPDYYNAMTFQFFSLLYIGWFGASDPARASRYSERVRLFAEDYARLFSARGEGVPYGRSMTYRFAQAGFWSMAAAVKIDLGAAFAPGALKGLIARNIQAWDEHAICDNGGVLTIGYKYPNLHMAEGYNAAGSPMWCLMAFACLALPADDEFWACGASPMLAWDASQSVALAGSALVRRDTVGEVMLYPSGRVPGHPFAQSDCKYSKFVYSSRFGFCVSRSQRTLEEAAPDSMLAFVVGGRVYVRDGVAESAVAEDAVVSPLVALRRHRGRNANRTVRRRPYEDASRCERDCLRGLRLRIRRAGGLPPGRSCRCLASMPRGVRGCGAGEGRPHQKRGQHEHLLWQNRHPCRSLYHRGGHGHACHPYRNGRVGLFYERP